MEVTQLEGRAQLCIAGSTPEEGLPWYFLLRPQQVSEHLVSVCSMVGRVKGSVGRVPGVILHGT